MINDTAELADAELMILCCGGRQAAFAEVMRRYRESVYRIALSSLGEPDAALDVVQETFLAAHRAAYLYDPAHPLQPWLTTIALNKVRDAHRRRKVRRWLLLRPPVDLLEVADDQPDIDRAVDARRLYKRVTNAVAELPSGLREPLVLHIMEGMSQIDVASILSISAKAVEMRIRRARQRLAATLDDPPTACSIETKDTRPYV